MKKRSNLLQQYKSYNKEFRKLEKFFDMLFYSISKSKKIMYELIPVIIIGESIFIMLGIIELSLQNVGITSVLLLLLQSKDFKGIL